MISNTALCLLFALCVGCVAGSPLPECIDNPVSDACIQSKAHAAESAVNPQRDADIATVTQMFHEFERVSNVWACSASWFGLYEVPGEANSFDNIPKILAIAMHAKGQLYAAAVLKYYARNVPPKTYTCEGLKFHDSAANDLPTAALLTLKDNIAAWMTRNEADPTEVLDFFVSQTRGIYASWIVSRLMTIRKTAPGLSRPSEEAVLAVLPILDGVGMEQTRCSSGGQLLAMFNSSETPRVRAKAEAFLAECVTAGRKAKKPQEYAKTLLGIGREREARDLFEVAVQRGQLCNPRQRPSVHHRKDIAARPVWSLDAFPKDVRSALLAVQDPLNSAVQKGTFPFSHDLESFSLFVADGKWERTLLYGREGLNATECARWGRPVCESVEKLIDVLFDANDAYLFACNESLVINLWRVQPGAATHWGIGHTNINLQIVMPIVAPDTAVVLQVGEEVVKVRQGDIAIVDDTFENKITVVDEAAEEEGRELATITDPETKRLRLDPAFAMPAGTVVLQIQLCHPDLHEKAMEVPSTKCVLTDS